MVDLSSNTHTKGRQSAVRHSPASTGISIERDCNNFNRKGLVIRHVCASGPPENVAFAILSLPILPSVIAITDIIAMNISDIYFMQSVTA